MLSPTSLALAAAFLCLTTFAPKNHKPAKGKTDCIMGITVKNDGTATLDATIEDNDESYSTTGLGPSNGFGHILTNPLYPDVIITFSSATPHGRIRVVSHNNTYSACFPLIHSTSVLTHIIDLSDAPCNSSLTLYYEDEDCP